MRRSIYLILGAVGLIFMGCDKKKDNDDVVSQRYIHKYGYAVSKDEFVNRKYPGQVITLLKSGVTISANYENGALHGVCTHTYPHSQTVESYFVYNQGRLVKEILYDVTGMPIREEIQLSPTRYSTTLWYADGTPMCIEEYANQELLDGQYFTTNNEVEARVEKGKGERVRRDLKGVLLYRDQVAEGYVTKHETFFPNGSPESLSYFYHTKLNGEKKTFTANGEPLATKEYVNGVLHGKTTLFKNGTKYLEVYYLDGKKNGLEIHYIDGEVVSQELLWEDDRRHGPSKYFVEGVAQTEYYYDGSLVSETKWNELSHIDEMIGQISPEAKQW